MQWHMFMIPTHGRPRHSLLGGTVTTFVKNVFTSYCCMYMCVYVMGVGIHVEVPHLSCLTGPYSVTLYSIHLQSAKREREKNHRHFQGLSQVGKCSKINYILCCPLIFPFFLRQSLTKLPRLALTHSVAQAGLLLDSLEQLDFQAYTSGLIFKLFIVYHFEGVHDRKDTVSYKLSSAWNKKSLFCEKTNLSHFQKLTIAGQ